MNKVILSGRLTRDPEVRTSEVGNNNTFCRFSLAVDRPWAKNNDNSQPTADFIGCVAFGKTAEFIGKYFHKGDPLIAEGRIQTGSYTNKNGEKVYTTDVAVEKTEFVPRNGGGSGQGQRDASEKRRNDNFMDIPDDADEDGLPFN